MNKCDECGFELITGLCRNCGLVSDNYTDFDFGDTYPYDKDDKSFSYGGARTQSVSDISVMTRVNKAECVNSNLRRALRWDGNYNWDVQKTEIVNQEMRRICDDLGLDQKFLSNCYYMFRKVRELTRLTGKRLENIASAIVYLMIRLYGFPYSLVDFRKNGYNINKTHNIFNFLLREVDLYKFIVPQDPEIFVLKIINELAENKDWDYEEKRRITLRTIHYFRKFINEHNYGEIDDCKSIGIGGVAAWVYLFSNCTQEEVASACGCSEVTLREYIEMIKPILPFFKNEGSDKQDKDS